MILCPSMMCASYANLEEEVRALEEAGYSLPLGHGEGTS